jgi:A/G-specific adenine glycosylase
MNPAAFTELRRKLLSWFRRKKRDLPWRASKDPYRVLVSEVMLQQTTTQAVLPAYERFLRAFPSVEDLARSSEEDVLSAWAGLGYYRRARALHQAAREISKEGWPDTARDLEKLPGIGPYTAAAVASIAFGEPVAVLDGNVIRVMSRFACVQGDPQRSAVKAKLLGLAQGFVSRRNPGDSNQALMELGAVVCRPTQPSCGECPLSGGCEALRHGTQDRYPTPRPRPASVEEHHAVFIVCDDKGRYLMEQRSEDGPLKGLWGFPMVGPLGNRKTIGVPAKKMRGPAKVDLVATEVHLVATARHSIMNRKLTLEVYTADAVPSSTGKQRRFATVAEIRKLPRSSIVDKVLKKLTVPGLGVKSRTRSRPTSGQASLFDPKKTPERKKKTPGRKVRSPRRRER